MTYDTDSVTDSVIALILSAVYAMLCSEIITSINEVWVNFTYGLLADKTQKLHFSLVCVQAKALVSLGIHHQSD